MFPWLSAGRGRIARSRRRSVRRHIEDRSLLLHVRRAVAHHPAVPRGAVAVGTEGHVYDAVQEQQGGPLECAGSGIPKPLRARSPSGPPNARRPLDVRARAADNR